MQRVTHRGTWTGPPPPGGGIVEGRVLPPHVTGAPAHRDPHAKLAEFVRSLGPAGDCNCNIMFAKTQIEAAWSFG